MTRTQTRDIREQDDEKAQEKKRRLEPAPLPVKVLADESVPFTGLLGVSAMEPPMESHAALLGDPRFSRSANNAQKAHMVATLQGTYGNQYVQRLVESFNVQAKLAVGSPNDEYEREADRVADAVTRAPVSSVQRQAEEEEAEEEEPIQAKPEDYTRLQRQAEEEEEEEKEEEEEPIQTKLTNDIQMQRQAEEPEEEEEEEEPIQTKLTNDMRVQRQAEEPEEEEEEEEEPIQTKLTNDIQVQQQAEEPEEEEKEEEPIRTKKAGRKTPLISSNLQSRINSLKGGGQPLPESTRRYFEPRFGSSFNNVRIHNSSQAANIADSISAKAFTRENDIIFGAAQYSPDTSTGRKLLAHELTHVVQQTHKPDRESPVLQRNQKSAARKQRRSKAKPKIGIRQVKQVRVSGTIKISSPKGYGILALTKEYLKAAKELHNKIKGLGGVGGVEEEDPVVARKRRVLNKAKDDFVKKAKAIKMQLDLISFKTTPPVIKPLKGKIGFQIWAIPSTPEFPIQISYDMVKWYSTRSFGDDLGKLSPTSASIGSKFCFITLNGNSGVGRLKVYSPRHKITKTARFEFALPRGFAEEHWTKGILKSHLAVKKELDEAELLQQEAEAYVDTASNLAGSVPVVGGFCSSVINTAKTFTSLHLTKKRAKARETSMKQTKENLIGVEKLPEEAHAITGGKEVHEKEKLALTLEAGG